MRTPAYGGPDEAERLRRQHESVSEPWRWITHTDERGRVTAITPVTELGEWRDEDEDYDRDR